MPHVDKIPTYNTFLKDNKDPYCTDLGHLFLTLAFSTDESSYQYHGLLEC